MPGGRHGGDTYNFYLPNYVGDRYELENAMIRVLNKAKQQGRV
jgi:hypothetical protein